MTAAGKGAGTAPERDERPWQRALAEAVTDLDELLALVAVSRDEAGAAADDPFPLRVPRPFVDRMRRGDARDPLLRQVLPTRLEGECVPGYRADPLQEGAAARASGLLGKYEGRLLMLAAGACAVHCRYCFRRHFPYGEHRQGADFPALEGVRADPGVREVILSGGDPLMLRDARLAALVGEIERIEHVRRLRIHTRLPIVIPARVTAGLVDTLAATRLRVAVVVHANHANEIDGDCAAALGPLARFALLNQSVLLRGVNDSAGALIDLSERLFDAGVLPYYLHLPDAVAGTAHFGVGEAQGRDLHLRMQAALPGYLVPRLVRETPGLPAKELLSAEPASASGGLDGVTEWRRG